MTAFVVLGQPKGGTSAVSGLLRLMGVHMGDHVGVDGDESNHEDVELHTADLDTIKRICRERHERYERWGWKDPLLVDRWDVVAPHVPDPAPIVVLRDPELVAKSEMAWTGVSYEDVFHTASLRYTKLCGLASRPGYHAIQFEKLRDRPIPHISDLAELVGYDLTVDAMSEMLRFVSGRYRTLDGEEATPPT